MTEPNLPVEPPTGPPSESPSEPPVESSQPPAASQAPARRPPVPAPAVQYKGEDLDAARGPGLGCFYVQLVLLVALLVATPVTVSAGWPPIVSMAMLVTIIVVLLFTGQTMIFLLRLVAADRGRRRPLAARSPTVGDIEAGADPGERAPGGAVAGPANDSAPDEPTPAPPERGGSVRE